MGETFGQYALRKLIQQQKVDADFIKEAKKRAKKAAKEERKRRKND